MFPKQLLLDSLPDSMDILCTHPMFGPDSGRNAWTGLNFQYEKVRINNGKDRLARVEGFLDVRSSVLFLNRSAWLPQKMFISVTQNYMCRIKASRKLLI